MKLPVKIVLSLVCAALVLAAPFVVSAPNMLDDAQWEIMDLMDTEESGFLSFLLPSANAEMEESPYSLPIDTSAGMKPNPDLFTEAGYEDDSIRVQMETRETDGDVIWRIAWVEIASPTQLRTAYAGDSIKDNKKKGTVSQMAKDHNAIVAIDGDNYIVEPEKHKFEYRMGEKRQADKNNIKDILIIDENGDFHTFIKSVGAKTFQQDTGHTIINAFMFGPALVHEGEISADPSYGYNPNGTQPRAAIGQLDRLSYVMVVADNATANDYIGVTHRELAEFMLELGCVEAYNLDGGNSAALVYNGECYNNKIDEREIKDIIYFATAVPPEEWEQ